MNSLQMQYIIKDLEVLFEDGIELDKIDKIKGKKFFITGSSGFIGQWLLVALHHLNTQHGFDLKILATAKKISDMPLLAHLSSDKNILFKELDVRSPFDIEQDTSYVIHLAGTPDRRVHASSPLDVLETIVSGTENTLKASSRIQHLEQALVFSSGHANGIMKPNEYGAEYLAPGCLSFPATYVESKRLSETISHLYANQYQLPIRIVRPYSFIGPLQKLERPWAVNNFIKDALFKNKINILGNPDTTKSFMYPTDMLAKILKYLLLDGDHPPLELGSLERISLENVAKTIARYCPSHIEYSDPERLTAAHDFFPIKENVNSKPLFTCDAAIEKTIQWFQLN